MNINIFTPKGKRAVIIELIGLHNRGKYTLLKIEALPTKALAHEEKQDAK